MFGSPMNAHSGSHLPPPSVGNSLSCCADPGCPRAPDTNLVQALACLILLYPGASRIMSPVRGDGGMGGGGEGG